MAPRNAASRDTTDAHPGACVRRCAHSGFTLLEVLIVLAVIALMAVVVGPGIGSSLGSVTRRTVERDVEIQLLEARLQAIDTAQTRVFADPLRTQGGAGGALNLPAGWTYRVQDLIEFRPDGGCTAGVILLDKPGEPTLTVPVDADTCRTRSRR